MDGAARAKHTETDSRQYLRLLLRRAITSATCPGLARLLFSASAAPAQLAPTPHHTQVPVLSGQHPLLVQLCTRLGRSSSRDADPHPTAAPSIPRSLASGSRRRNKGPGERAPKKKQKGKEKRGASSERQSTSGRRTWARAPRARASVSRPTSRIRRGGAWGRAAQAGSHVAAGALATMYK